MKFSVGAVRRSRLLELLWKVHRAAYRASGGRLGARVGPLPVLLLTAVGRRSGRPRSVALNYFDDGEGLVVIASNTGEDRHPEWWRNLEANPVAEVQVGTRSRRVRARRATGEERERLWSRLVALDPSYDLYRQRTAREIPMVVLEPTARG